MKTAFKSDLESKTFYSKKSYVLLKEKDTNLIGSKFYQKLFIVFFSLSTILIFPDSPRELENICKSYNSNKLCNVW